MASPTGEPIYEMLDKLLLKIQFLSKCVHRYVIVTISNMPSTIVYIFRHVLRYDWHSGHARKYFGFLYNLNLTVKGDYINGLSNTFHSRATPCSIPIPSFVLGIVVAFGCYDTNLRILCKLFCMELIKNTSLPMISRFWVRNVRNIKPRLNTRTKEENHEDTKV